VHVMLGGNYGAAQDLFLRSSDPKAALMRKVTAHRAGLEAGRATGSAGPGRRGDAGCNRRARSTNVLLAHCAPAIRYKPALLVD
jgi:hypothetical protein